MQPGSKYPGSNMLSTMYPQNSSQFGERLVATFDLSLPESGTEVSTEDRVATITALLVDRITFLLSRQPERLMSILYRIDVREADVQRIFSTVFPTEVPFHLAELIVAREREKQLTRQHLRSQKPDK